MRWRWRWIRAGLCVAPIPFPPTFTLPAAALLSHSLLTRHLLSAAAASRSSPTRQRCAVDPAPAHKLKFSCTTARAIQLPRAPSTHASHARSLRRPDPTSSSEQPHAFRKAFALEIHRLCVLVTADSRLRPCSGHTPVPASGFKLGCTTLLAHAMSVPAPAILFPPTPSLPSFTPFPVPSLPARCPRLVPYSLVPPLPSQPCSHFGGDVDHAGARTSVLASCQSWADQMCCRAQRRAAHARVWCLLQMSSAPLQPSRLVPSTSVLLIRRAP
jgi:hypothetical protein